LRRHNYTASAIPIPFLTSPLKGEEDKHFSPLRGRDTTISLPFSLPARSRFGEGRGEGKGGGGPNQMSIHLKNHLER